MPLVIRPSCARSAQPVVVPRSRASIVELDACCAATGRCRGSALLRQSVGHHDLLEVRAAGAMAASGRGLRRSPEPGMGQVSSGRAGGVRRAPEILQRVQGAQAAEPDRLTLWSLYIIYILQIIHSFHRGSVSTMGHVCGVYAPARKIEPLRDFEFPQADSAAWGSSRPDEDVAAAVKELMPRRPRSRPARRCAWSPRAGAGSSEGRPRSGSSDELSSRVRRSRNWVLRVSSVFVSPPCPAGG